MKRQNCWEFMGCGREPGGRHADAEGICRAATEDKLDGVHGGVNGGRSCWAVVGTMCHEAVADSRIAKTECFACPFYRSVLNDEAPHIVYTPAILALLGAPSGEPRWLRGTSDDD